MRVRIKLRRMLKREPTADEMEQRLLEGRTKEISWGEIMAAFKSGKEVSPGPMPLF